MAPSLPRPTSPTSLLWAHQLKREHGLLTDRQRTLETLVSRIEEQASSAVRSALEDRKALEAKIEELYRADAKTQKSILDLQSHESATLDELKEQVGVIRGSVDGLESARVTAESDKRRAMEGQVAVLRRIGDIEARLKSADEVVESLKMKVDGHVSAEDVHALIGEVRRLESLMSQARDQNSITIARFEERVDDMSSGVERIRQENEALRKEMDRLATKTSFQAQVNPSIDGPASKGFTSNAPAIQTCEAPPDGTFPGQPEQAQKVFIPSIEDKSLRDGFPVPVKAKAKAKAKAKEKAASLRPPKRTIMHSKPSEQRKNVEEPLRRSVRIRRIQHKSNEQQGTHSNGNGDLHNGKSLATTSNQTEWSRHRESKDISKTNTHRSKQRDHPHVDGEPKIGTSSDLPAQHRINPKPPAARNIREQGHNSTAMARSRRLMLADENDIRALELLREKLLA